MKTTNLFVNLVPVVDGLRVIYNCSDEQLKIVLAQFTKENILPEDSLSKQGGETV